MDIAHPVKLYKYNFFGFEMDIVHLAKLYKYNFFGFLDGYSPTFKVIQIQLFSIFGMDVTLSCQVIQVQAIRFWHGSNPDIFENYMNTTFFCRFNPPPL